MQQKDTKLKMQKESDKQRKLAPTYRSNTLILTPIGAITDGGPEQQDNTPLQLYIDHQHNLDLHWLVIKIADIYLYIYTNIEW